jgi:hypothetical protein
MKLGGWLRLWIVLSAIYAIGIASFYNFLWFTNSTDTTNHEQYWLKIATTTYQSASTDKKSLPRPNVGDRMNGYVFVGGDARSQENWIPEGDFFHDLYLKERNEVTDWARINVEAPIEDIDKFSRTIFSANDRSLEWKSIAFYEVWGPPSRWVLMWIIPIIAMLLLGWSVRCVVLGFKQRKQ